MRVFMSWSGETSKALAQQLTVWLPHVIQGVKPYFSPVDLAKGTRWDAELAAELEQADFGIVALTRDNVEAPWIMFEAGAISKGAKTSRVCPILFGISTSNVKFPLAQFNLTKFNQSEMFQLLVSINEQLEKDVLDATLLRDTFEKWWPDLETAVTNELNKPQDETALPPRDSNSILEEILALTRSVAVSGVRTADTYRYTLELVQAYEHIIQNTKKEWISILRHCLIWIGGAIYPLTELTGDDELSKRIIFQVIRVWLWDYTPGTTSDLIGYFAFNTGIPKEVLLRYRSTVDKAIQNPITEAPAPEKAK